MSDIEFVSGLIVKAPHANAPEYVKAAISIKRTDLIAWLTAQDGDWINVQVKESKGGKWYAAVDDWKPNGEAKPQRQESRGGGGQSAPSRGDEPFPDDDIPFVSMFGTF